MNFDYSEEQQLLADSVRRFLAKDYAFEARKRIVASAEGASGQVWATFVQMGLTGLPFPAEHGGPMYLADRIGLASVHEDVKRFHEAHGVWWEPAPLVERLAREGGSFAPSPARGRGPG